MSLNVEEGVFIECDSEARLRTGQAIGLYVLSLLQQFHESLQ